MQCIRWHCYAEKTQRSSGAIDTKKDLDGMIMLLHSKYAGKRTAMYSPQEQPAVLNADRPQALTYELDQAADVQA